MHDLRFEALRNVNVTRCARWHPPGSVPWTAADWSNAMCGEAGELANVVKKIRRHETGAINEGDPSPDALRAMAAAELADVVIYADLLAAYLGVDLGAAVVAKFNKVSQKYGFPERLVDGLSAASPVEPTPEAEQRQGAGQAAGIREAR